MCSVDSQGGTEKNSYYLENTGAQKEIIRDLFTLLGDRNNTNDVNFSIIREITNQYSRQNDNYRMINFLSEWVTGHEKDPYNSYYLLRIADCYLHEDSPEISALYFKMILENYPDLIVHDGSIHLACLQHLITLISDPAAKASYYKQLIEIFPGKINLAETWFMLGQAEEQNGNWRGAIEAYQNFLPFNYTSVTGFPAAFSYAKHIVDFYTAEKYYDTPAKKYNKTYASLDSLIASIKKILQSGEMWRLWDYRARVNFFARSWTMIGSEDVGYSSFSLSTLYSSGKIKVADSLSEGSGSNDAFLRTSGWSKINPIWYFYFRKIYFPMDPDLHGRWEWAGIYFGERF